MTWRLLLSPGRPIFSTASRYRRSVSIPQQTYEPITFKLRVLRSAAMALAFAWSSGRLPTLFCSVGSSATFAPCSRERVFPTKRFFSCIARAPAAMNTEQGSRSTEADDMSTKLSQHGREPQKVHRSAICVVPPEELWGSIQDIRRVHDKASVYVLITTIVVVTISTKPSGFYVTGVQRAGGLSLSSTKPVFCTALCISK